jgi:transcriptional regulator with XRE-family HTH domain
MPFNETLQNLREAAGLTQAALAEKSGVPLRTIQGWEQGYRCPVSEDFFRVVAALGVSADSFAEGVVSPNGTGGRKRKRSLRRAPRM